MEKERRMQILDITITVLLFMLGCIAGKIVMTAVADIWLAFNALAVGIYITSEFVWWRVKKILKKKED